MERRLQNKVAESSATLPGACVLTIILWWFPQAGFSLDYLLGLLVCFMTAYVVMEMTTVNALLRVRSRMNSSLFLFLMAVCGFLHPLYSSGLMTFLLAATLFTLFKSYEQYDATTDILHASSCLSLGSLLWPPILLLSPILLFCQLIFLRSLSWRMLGAWCMGLLLPYWLWLAYVLFIEDVTPLMTHLANMIEPFHQPFYWQWMADLTQTSDWQGFTEGFSERWAILVMHHRPHMIAFTYVFILGLTGLIHYLRNSYNDKTQVRMCFNVILTLQVVLAIWILLQPVYFNRLFPLLILTTAPAASHFFTLTRTWLTNAWFILCTLGLVFVGAFTLIQ